jgi:hypothetical protein
MELLVILGVLAAVIATYAVVEDNKRQKREFEEFFLLDLPVLEPVKKKAPAKKAAKKAAKKPVKKATKKAAKKPVKKAAKKAKKKPQPKKKKRASVIK